MTRAACDRLWEAGPYREGAFAPKDAASFERHALTCPDCREQLHRDEMLSRLAAHMPEEVPTDLELRRTRSQVLRTVAMGASREHAFHASAAAAFGVLAIACALAVHAAGPRTGAPSRLVTVTSEPTLAASSPSPEVEVPPSSVTVVGGARWSRVFGSGLERVVLDDGTVRIHVRHLPSNERFLVTMPDGELEVKGTTFEVEVEHAETDRVHVDEGFVELRLRGRDPLRLTADETWSSGGPSSTSASAAVVTPATRPWAVEVPASPGATSTSAYATGIQLMREQRYAEAASAFHDAAASTDTGRAEDASFLEAAALARAGRGAAAAAAAEAHLARFPHSFHRREASMLVARAALGRGDCARLAAVLAEWVARRDAAALSMIAACPSH